MSKTPTWRVAVHTRPASDSFKITVPPWCNWFQAIQWALIYHTEVSGTRPVATSVDRVTVTPVMTGTPIAYQHHAATRATLGTECFPHVTECFPHATPGGRRS
jgi:hypothetical protein